MAVADNILGVWSVIWRGFCGAILLYVSSNLIAVTLGSVAYFIRDDFLVLKEIISGAMGGLFGATAGCWILDKLLKRYPGRTIAWIFVVLTVINVVFFVIGFVMLFTYKDAPTMKEYLKDFTLFRLFSSVAEAFVFYHTLIEPKFNFMTRRA